ncbi:hypothetical protein A3B18_01635 [Candidatus Giovannonibacteria bacterium RIFCSPLOWO2_01_FULL_46_13]|uniref:PE-PGRS family protein n=1 Tax=Candidatus Giovannonibacteria bacterium RIFCSPLOWO2_01_FULL_46_13 TaxID=1798352 RepID=A0A1F5X649_9BACT|nr:MAG: hypothetical protein A3B18_01635 [Candidatus Giovannonibacteria bacterium RIFCSPLOWO2_01_FULL_46_13]
MQIKKMIKKIIASTVLMPAMALGLYAAPVLASMDFENNDVIVKNSNWASVTNVVASSASTGGNDANGGNGSNGGNGGDITNSGDDVEESGTGNGGNGGNGGEGGGIQTGEAISSAKAVNFVNSNKTSLSLLCGCAEDLDDVEGNYIKVKNRNDATVTNVVASGADTGNNVADGGTADNGGNGGSIDNSGEDVENVGTGNGGHGGNGGLGGLVITGGAYSKAKAFNVVNKNVTRIR